MNVKVFEGKAGHHPMVLEERIAEWMDEVADHICIEHTQAIGPGGAEGSFQLVIFYTVTIPRSEPKVPESDVPVELRCRQCKKREAIKGQKQCEECKAYEEVPGRSQGRKKHGLSVV